MGFCMCLSSGGSTDRNQIYEVNDYGQENAVLYSEQHDVPQDVGSVSSLTGGKGFNQDAAILHLGYGTQDGALCGVFDGHGDQKYGQLVSRIVRNQLPSLLLGHMNNHSVTRDSKLICETAFLAMDKRILKFKKTLDCSSSGTAAVVAVKQGNQIMVANLGDSRAVMIRTSEMGETEVVQLTNDLKPSVPSEAERIRKRNGRVLALESEPHIKRVWLPNENAPGLAMSRSFGDFVLKSYGVIATPQVSTHQITPRDQFLLLASDGVWDVLSNEEVATVVMKSANESAAASAVTEAAANAWRQKYPTIKVDDISVVCLSLSTRNVNLRSSSTNMTKPSS
uniref:PPM-type phosphatase domain-containing protein n=1 Tax=Noccaea caerulescens TaxID=107243 RepID=A0A1J3GX80_NOCCA